MNETQRKVRNILEDYFGPGFDERLEQAFEPVDLRGGDWLFREGEAGDSLYFLVRGRLQAWSGEGRSARLLGEIVPGDSVGEAGLLSGAPRSAGVRAIRDSFLVRLGQAPFEALSSRHPGMVMKLAARVAELMQRNILGTGHSQRAYSTICLVRVGASQRVHDSTEALAASLCRDRRGLALGRRRLDAAGAPDRLESDGSLGEGLRSWLADREDEHDVLLYLCDAEDSAWTRFALRQSDLTLWMADAEASPIPGAAERALEPAGAQALVLHHPAGAEIRDTGVWLESRHVDFHLHLREDHAEDRQRLERVLRGQAIGLVLGAGAVRGLSELGVYQAMVELGVPVDWVGGSSIGSIVAGAIARGWDPEHAIAMARESFVGGKPFSDYTVPVISLIRGKRMVRLLRKHLDVDIEDLPIPYFCVSSRLDRGEVHVHERGNLVEAIRASAALPGVLPPAVVDSELVVDGAVLNNLPVDIMLRQPVGPVIAVDVSFQGARKVDFDETPSSWAVLRGRFLPFAERYRVPSLATLILRATEIGTLVQSRQRGAAADLLITPDVRQFRMTDVKAFDAIVEKGYEAGRESLAAWLESRNATDGTRDLS
ncbi:MAG: patatin-like phospholipase family protein [Xanthomonadales bacterium]|jgi:predicted acylesterase/phospholipase RssA/CRP-like cAMP-binding protein|nr:patatin-like phospholipase family protein [Xanthomonadales bacterium]